VAKGNGPLHANGFNVAEAFKDVMIEETGASRPWSVFNVKLAAGMLREAAGIRGDVAVYGNLTYLEVRNLEVSKQLAEEQFTTEDEKTLDELGI